LVGSHLNTQARSPQAYALAITENSEIIRNFDATKSVDEK